MRHIIKSVNPILRQIETRQLLLDAHLALDSCARSCISPVLLELLDANKTKSTTSQCSMQQSASGLLHTFSLLYQLIDHVDAFLSSVRRFIDALSFLCNAGALKEYSGVCVLMMHMMGRLFQCKDRGILAGLGFESAPWSAFRSLAESSDHLLNLLTLISPQAYSFMNDLLVEVKCVVRIIQPLLARTDQSSGESFFISGGKTVAGVLSIFNPVSSGKRFMGIQNDLIKLLRFLKEIQDAAALPCVTGFIGLIEKYGEVLSKAIDSVILSRSTPMGAGINILKNYGSDILCISTMLQSIIELKKQMHDDFNEQLYDIVAQMQPLIFSGLSFLDQLEVDGGLKPGLLTSSLESCFTEFFIAFIANLNVDTADELGNLLPFLMLNSFSLRKNELFFRKNSSNINLEKKLCSESIDRLYSAAEKSRQQVHVLYPALKYEYLLNQFIEKEVITMQAQLLDLEVLPNRLILLKPLERRLRGILNTDYSAYKDTILDSIKKKEGDYSVNQFLSREIKKRRDPFLINGLLLLTCVNELEKISNGFYAQFIRFIRCCVDFSLPPSLRYKKFSEQCPDELIKAFADQSRGCSFFSSKCSDDHIKHVSFCLIRMIIADHDNINCIYRLR